MILINMDALTPYSTWSCEYCTIETNVFWL